MLLLACLVALFALLSAGWLARRLGQTGINILKRIFGLITGAIAVEFMVGGLAELLPGLRGS
jgi:multiple antibiotic resistance protein